MKRFIALVLAVLSFMSVLAVSASAATDKSIVMQELAQLSVGGVQFNEANYPKNETRTDIEVLAVVEKGFQTIKSSPNYAMYIYVYNPSCKPFDAAFGNTVQIGVNLDSSSNSFYGLEIRSRSNDYRFYKFKVITYGANTVSKLYGGIDDVTNRIYNVVTLRLLRGNVLTSYTVKKVAIFSGYNDNVTCSMGNGEAVEVELHDVTWVSPNAGSTITGEEADKYDHYEIHSVYFAIKREVLAKYDYLSSIRASFEQVKLTPIVVTRKGNLSEETVAAIQNVKRVDENYIDVDDLVAAYVFGGVVSDTDWWWSNNNLISDITVGATSEQRLNYLAYLFYSDQLSENMDLGEVSSILGVDSGELKKRYYDLLGKGVSQKLLCSKREIKEMDYVTIEKDAKAGLFYLKEYSEKIENYGGIEKWWFDSFIPNDSYLKEQYKTEVEYIEVIEPSKYANLRDEDLSLYCNELKINACDMPGFKEECAKAEEEDEVIVILRYGVADYRCLPIYDVAELTGASFAFGDPVAYSIEKSVYLSVSVAQIGFTKDGKETIVPAASNVVDSFGDVYIYNYKDAESSLSIGGGGGGNPWGKLRDTLKKLVFVVLIIVLIVVVILVAPHVIRVFSAAGSAARQRRRDREADRESRQNRDKKNE